MKFSLPAASLARTSFQVMLWQGMRLICLAGWIVVAARTLGAQNYGVFSGIVGIASALAGLVGLGSGMLMYQYSASDRSRFGRYWKQTRVLCALSSPPLALALLLFSSTSTSDSISLIEVALIASSEILTTPYVTNAAFAFSANERLGWAAALPAITAFFRLTAIAMFGALPIDRDLDHYLLLHLVASVCGAAVALIAVKRLLTPQWHPLQVDCNDLYHGVGHAASWTTATSVTTLDKSFVLHAGGDTTAGLYAACYRLASVAAMPLDAMVMSAMPRLFRAHGDNGRVRRLLFAMFVVAGTYSTFIIALLWSSATLLPYLLGFEFANAVPALRWMGFFILAYSLRQIACQALVGRGLKLRKTFIEGGGLLAMSVLCAILVPRYGLTGAIAMIIAAEAAMAIVAWLTLSLSAARSNDGRILPH